MNTTSRVHETLQESCGKYVKLEDTIRGFKEIVAGEHDDLPEQAFYMVGGINDVIAKADKLSQEAA